MTKLSRSRMVAVNRRTFFAVVAGLPFAGRAFRSPPPAPPAWLRQLRTDRSWRQQAEPDGSVTFHFEPPEVEMPPQFGWL